MHLLIRACKKRITAGDGSTWLDAARATACLFKCSVNVSARTAKVVPETRKRHETRDARIAELEV